MAISTRSDHDFSHLRAGLAGSLVAHGEEAYDTAREAWNLTADQRPAAVVFAQSATDVAATVRAACELGLRVAPQGTGHGAAALGSLDDAILLRTLRMDGITIDPERRVARVEAGVRWGDLAQAAGEHGLVGLGGSSPTVGVVGYCLGGGIGWLGRKHGLGSDSVTAIELVTGEGEEQRVTEGELFWALRGGGSFGVVTAIELELQPYATLFAGGVKFDAADGARMFDAYREWAAGAPEEATSAIRFLTLPPLPHIPEELHLRPLVDITGAYAGDPAEGERVFAPLRALGEPLLDTFAEIPAADLCRIHGDPEMPIPGLSAHVLLDDLTPEVIGALVEHAGPESGSPLIMASVRHCGGALGREGEGAGALGRIDAGFTLAAIGAAMAPGMGEAVAARQAQLFAAIPGTGRAYLNFQDAPCGADAAFDGETLARLRAVRDAVDPNRRIVTKHPLG